MTIACCEPANYTGACYRDVDDGDDIAEFTLECRLKYGMGKVRKGVAVCGPRT